MSAQKSLFTSTTAKAMLCLFLILSLGACSLFKSGSKDSGSGALSDQDLNAQREARFSEGGIPLAEGEGIFRDVNFDYDSSLINDLARQDVEYNVQILKANPDVKVQVEGHCDERGTAEYNMALGARRARAVQEALISLGVSGARLDTISYGSEVPLDPGHNESAWAKNRRAHFSPFRDTPPARRR
jgi:peptidoglycan-associated lipoprotein